MSRLSLLSSNTGSLGALGSSGSADQFEDEEPSRSDEDEDEDESAAGAESSEDGSTKFERWPWRLMTGSPPSKPAALTVTRTSSPSVSSMTAPKMILASGWTASCTSFAAPLISK